MGAPEGGSREVYRPHKKIIPAGGSPKNINNLLTARSLAYCADGAVRTS